MKLADLNPDEMPDLVAKPGFSIVSNQILNDGLPILFMYREESIEEEDSGWRFLSGQEDQDYLDDPENSRFIGLNTMANMEEKIIRHLKKSRGTELERDSADEDFRPMKPESDES